MCSDVLARHIAAVRVAIAELHELRLGGLVCLVDQVDVVIANVNVALVARETLVPAGADRVSAAARVCVQKKEI
jgi:hypothetical protein